MKFSLQECDGVARFREPVALGMGVPPGVAVTPLATAVDTKGRRYPANCRVLTRRGDGSAMWILVQACLDADADSVALYSLEFDPETNVELQTSASEVTKDSHLDSKAGNLHRAIALVNLHETIAGWNLQLSVRSVGGNRWQLPLSIDQIDFPADTKANSNNVIESKCYASQLEGTSIRAEFSLTYFIDSSKLRIDATLHNPNRAEHPDGFWDLGDPMSYRLESAVLSVQNLDLQFDDVRWRTDQDQPSQQHSLPGHLQLVQHHSGGVNAQSRNHLRADGNLPPSGPSCLKIFTKNVDADRSNQNSICENYENHRFQPVVTLNDKSSSVTATMLDFWEKYPSSIEADEQGFHFGLLAKSNRGHQELQGGEETTRTIWLSFDCSSKQKIKSDDGHHQLDWVHRPVTALQDPRELTESGSIDWFTASENLENPKLQTLFDELLDGENSFFRKRETIDEYGWRNFGDVWADHEQAYSLDPKPVISHYNNQYDLLQGLLRRYLQTGDRRWWNLARPLAEHVMDIDLYRTDQDRAAYNGGMFWHTSHYRDAGTCTHRTFSRCMTGDEHRVSGGGPSNEHNYTSGLLLYYHLTGSRRAAAAVCSLADWVIAMDDGDQSPLSPLSGRATGYASSTSQSSFHGPGRGVANSIHALLDAWTLTRSDHYLEKCEALIYRSIHPLQDFQAMDLLHAELRWSYSIALQALLRFVHLASGQSVQTCRFVLAALHRYGAWMQQSEKHFLDRPDELEFPTETWAAQDLRKGTTMMMIARYQPESTSSDALFQAGKAFFDRALDQLFEFPTRSCTRPAAILLQQVPVLMAALESPMPPDIASMVHQDLTGPWPAAESWRFQKADIRRSIRSPLQFPRLVLRLAGIHRWPFALAESPIGKRWRTKFRKTSSL
jgi:hypothetical protein